MLTKAPKGISAPYIEHTAVAEENSTEINPK